VLGVATLLLCASAGADPGGGASSPTWVEHRVLPGERLGDIAARYAIDEDSILRDNGIGRTELRAGATIRVHARRVPAPRKRIEYMVRFGDNWSSIAERHGVTRTALQRWNPEVPRTFEAGTELSIWVDGDYVAPPPTGGLGLDADGTGLPLLPVPAGGESAGRPDHGRLIDGVQLPDNRALYLIRRPDHAWGSSHAVVNLQLALAKFRDGGGYDGPLVVSDMSGRRGRSYGTHDSHQSGRDVDLWLPLKLDESGATVRGVRLEAGELPEDFQQLAVSRPSDVDWRAAWELCKALIRTGQVQYIFLSRTRQRHLYAAARADGLSVQALGEVMQYPRRAQTGIIRHAPDHHRHMHVRFRCADHERRCR